MSDDRKPDIHYFNDVSPPDRSKTMPRGIKFTDLDELLRNLDRIEPAKIPATSLVLTAALGKLTARLLVDGTDNGGETLRRPMPIC